MKKVNWVLLIIFVLMAISLACRLGFQRQSTAEPPVPDAPADMNPQPDSQDDNQLLGNTEAMQFTITQSQLTTILSSKLAQVAGDAVSDLRIILSDGEIKASGRVKQQGITLPINITAEVGVDAAGSPKVNITSASAGIFPVPGDMVAEIEVAINRAFQGELQSMAPNLHIETIVIHDGVMTISGQKN